MLPPLKVKSPALEERAKGPRGVALRASRKALLELEEGHPAGVTRGELRLR